MTENLSASPAAPTAGHDDLTRARDGDDLAFTRLVEPLRGELHAHCYRMLGSVHDADDALQAALLRAWRGIAQFEGRSALRSWLYAVATRTCLDALSGRARRALPVDLGPASEHAVLGAAPLHDVAWLGPYPDARLAAAGLDPEACYEQREALELAFVAALHHLPGNQRAALVLFDVLGFSAAEIATMLETSVPSVNSALQRARATMTSRSPSRTQQQTARQLGNDRLQAIVTRYSNALERGDADGLVALLAEDVTWSMPPLPQWYQGIEAVTDFAVRVPLSSCGAWRHLPARANAQPAVACYLQQDPGGAYLAWSIDVLTLRDERIVAITAFVGPEHHAALGLPAALPAATR